MSVPGATTPTGIAPAGTACPCVVRHAPQPRSLDYHHLLPESWGGLRELSNMIWLCPNAHRNIHSLLDLYVRYKGTPPEHELAKFSKFTRAHAAEGVSRYRAANSGVWPTRYALHHTEDPATMLNQAITSSDD
jgi:hypothetical protein